MDDPKRYYIVESDGPDVMLLMKTNVLKEIEVCRVCGSIYYLYSHRANICPVGHVQDLYEKQDL